MKRKKTPEEYIADKQLLQSALHDYEPVFSIIIGALGLGLLENIKWGDSHFQLISTNQKRVLLAGLLGVEVARSGLIGQVTGATGQVAGATGQVVGDLGSLVTGLIAGSA